MLARVEHRYDIGVEQVHAHSNSEPSGRSFQGRSVIGSLIVPARACRARRAPRLGADRARLCHSFSATIITASLPWRVTRWGSPASARSKSFENSARASFRG